MAKTENTSRPEPESEVENVSSAPAPAGLSWAQKLAKAKQDAAASRPNSNLEEAVGEVLELTGISILPMRSSKYADCQEKATLFVVDGRVYDTYSQAGVSSCRILLDALGPVWDGGNTVSVAVEEVKTAHGQRQVIRPHW